MASPVVFLCVIIRGNVEPEHRLRSRDATFLHASAGPPMEVRLVFAFSSRTANGPPERERNKLTPSSVFDDSDDDSPACQDDASLLVAYYSVIFRSFSRSAFKEPSCHVIA